MTTPQQQIGILLDGTPAFVGGTVAPPSTTTPVASSLITSGGINLPQNSSLANNNGASLVNSIIPPAPTPTTTSSTPALDLATSGDYTKDPGYQTANSTLQGSINDYKNAQLPSSSDLLTSAEQSTGANDYMKKVQELNTQIAEKKAAYDVLSQSKETHGVQNGTASIFYQGEQSAIQRQAAVELGALGSIQAAAQGNYQLAEDRAVRTANLQFQDQQAKIDRLKSFIDLNRDNLSQSEKLAISKMGAQANQQQIELDQQKEARTFALSNGITAPFYEMAGTVYNSANGKAYSTPQEAEKAGVNITNWSNVQKLNAVSQAVKFSNTTIGSGKNAVKYRDGFSAAGNLVSRINLATGQQVDLTKGGGSQPGSNNSSNSSENKSTPTNKPATAKMDARVKQIISIHPNEWGNAADQIDREFGAGTATKYNDLLTKTYNKSAGGGKA